MMRALLGGIAALCVSLSLWAQTTLPLKEEFPSVYVVKEGDTLWDIAGVFLRDPWLWPEIWQVNPQVSNPHLIFPGDRLSLVYVDGQPRLQITRGETSRTVKLGPQVRSLPLDRAIPAIPLDKINAFLSRSRIVEGDEFQRAPHVLSGGEGHLVSGAGEKVYGRGVFPEGERAYGIYRAGQTFVDPVTGEVLGYEATNIGLSRLLTVEGEVGTLQLNQSREEVRRGDRLLIEEQRRLDSTFFPTAPSSSIDGVILAVEGGVTQVGYLDVVILNRGQREGLAIGDVLAIDKAGEVVRDVVKQDLVRLPSTQAGLLMVFRSFEKLSYALVLQASRPLTVGDVVRNP